MELIKVTNAGIQLSGSFGIPVIRAVVNGLGGEHTAQEMNDLMLDIYNHALGAVSVTTYFEFFPQPDPVDFIYEGGTTYYGNDNGFKLQRTVQDNVTPSHNRFQVIRFSLYYKGDHIATASVYTGYNTFEYGFLVILTDEDYNIYVGQASSPHGIYLRSDHELGIRVNGDVLVCGVWEDGEYVDVQDGITYPALPSHNIKDDITNEIDPDPNPDPYDPEGDEGTEPGGGDGDHDLGSDDIDIPPLPGLSAVDTGFITLFNPSLSQLQDLSDYLWSPLFDIDTVKKLFADPMDVFLGLSIVPVQVPSGGSKTVKVAGISTGVNMTVAARQYIEVDCGSINVNEYWGAYLDYEPYTKAELYLPYIGAHPIAIDDIMGKTITIKYHVDILSGACVAYVKCGKSVLYTFIGQCSSSIPINRSDWTSVINGALNIATAIGTMVATGGSSAPMSSGASAEGASAAASAKEARKTAAMIRGASNIASTAVNVMKPSIEKSGAISGTGGMMAIQKPYLIITRPRQAVPNNQKHYMGYPSFMTTYLSALSGYTEMEYVHLEGISATDEELSEIEALLRGGVYL